MRFTMTLPEKRYSELTEHLFSDRSREAAAFLLCKMSRTTDETRMLVRRVIPVVESDVLTATATGMSITPAAFLRAMKQADRRRESFVFVHSHPPSCLTHSTQDDREERQLFSTAYNRIHNGGPHASLVFSDPTLPRGRVWLADGGVRPIELIRIIGARFRFYFSDGSSQEPFEVFDRQVRAFGKDNQRLLGKIKVGIVGTGGTGSAVAEQLIRLGVGSLLIIDGQDFDSTNVNRVYGSRIDDSQTPKVRIVERLSREIGLGTHITAIHGDITLPSVMKELRQCDILFGCTDNQWSRSLLTVFSIHYCTPVFDLGVRIDSNDGKIRSVQGRVTTLMPSASCLFCRRRISPAAISHEQKNILNPAEADSLRAEGYIPDLPEPAPSVIPFTTAVAAAGVSELLHRLTGFMGVHRESSELLYLFDASRVRTNAVKADPTCFCADENKWCLGDRTPFLETVWREAS